MNTLNSIKNKEVHEKFISNYQQTFNFGENKILSYKIKKANKQSDSPLLRSLSSNNQKSKMAEQKMKTNQ